MPGFGVSISIPIGASTYSQPEIRKLLAAARYGSIVVQLPDAIKERRTERSFLALASTIAIAKQCGEDHQAFPPIPRCNRRSERLLNATSAVFSSSKA
ncbi:hypothetical protein HAP48_0024380 [Bradyrhizobium septentrionale]|uniref:Uncharacterized protein n=1 Tax=Bradyrhizobium septentrionale TaxID=1404411 RepID=A0A973ZZP1_9BRAD|nr:MULTISPECIES: hypothetical protein [Bradyrhizobium]UGY20281.1 hypothetical protein HAP48_0024380 [Bradyrhizobium septentrionale]UGY29113.1 hypothetical protein HU675_0021645 [Bradyrhizobium septentrionale]